MMRKLAEQSGVQAGVPEVEVKVDAAEIQRFLAE